MSGPTLRIIHGGEGSDGGETQNIVTPATRGDVDFFIRSSVETGVEMHLPSGELCGIDYSNLHIKCVHGHYAYVLETNEGFDFDPGISKHEPPANVKQMMDTEVAAVWEVEYSDGLVVRYIFNKNNKELTAYNLQLGGPVIDRLERFCRGFASRVKRLF